MPFDPVIAAIRFGTGLSPDVAPPASVADMLARLTGPDAAAARWPIVPYATATPSVADLRAFGRQRRAAAEQGEAALAEVAAREEAARMSQRATATTHFASAIARAVGTSDGLRERLTRFWADHFTVVSRNGVTNHLVGSYVEEAIRPHVAGRFVDMLQAVVTHPMMLVYLDQASSVGPDSRLGQRRGQGLNENLAREVLELHTLGVDGTYSQTDVRELAELMTGLSVSAQGAFEYRVNAAEPGAETVLGVEYDAEAEVDTVLAALDGIAAHPDTARHIATKLAVHFLADTPDADVIAVMMAAYQATGGDLLAVYRAMLDHPAAWDPTPAKVKTPFDFVTSAARALGVSADAIADLSRRDLTQVFEAPMRIMGQPWERPTGPDGWPEEAAAWVTPQGMAGRINWAMSMPARMTPDLPDPRDFVLQALGPIPPEAVAFAARASESRAEGVGVVLASAAFQRR